MINYDDAVLTAQAYLNGIKMQPPMVLVLMLDRTREFEYGWVFFYQSKEYLDSGNILDALGGNAPIIVNKYDGSLHVTGTAHAVEWYIAKYVKEIKNKQ